MAHAPRLLSGRERLAYEPLRRSRHRSRRRPGHHRLLWTLPVLAVAALVVFFFAVGGHKAGWPSSPSLHLQGVPLFGARPLHAARRLSRYSFDLAALLSPDASASAAAGRTAAWMADAPDDWSLARLALPGTHDTMTHRLNEKETGGAETPDGLRIATVFRCQNNPLDVQLAAGVRYLDIRARVQVQPSASAAAAASAATPAAPASPPPLGIYHADVYTGYDFAAVAQTVFAFLDQHPSEAVVLRLKEEDAPVRASAADPPGCWHGGADRRVDTDADAATAAPFLASFDHYRLHDPRTAPGFAKHVYQPVAAAAADDDDNDHDDGTAAAAIPTVGALRGKVLLLQEFPYFVRGGGPADPGNSTAFRPRHGLPWRLASPQLQVEDDWRIADLARLDGKWAAIEANLRAAAAANAEPAPSPAPLFLSHLSASVGVTPIDAAAGPVNGSVVGINDRTGPWLAAAAGADGSSDNATDARPPPVGIVIADFPGRRLVEAILRRNSFVSY